MLRIAMADDTKRAGLLGAVLGGAGPKPRGGREWSTSLAAAVTRLWEHPSTISNLEIGHIRVERGRTRRNLRRRRVSIMPHEWLSERPRPSRRLRARSDHALAVHVKYVSGQ